MRAFVVQNHTFTFALFTGRETTTWGVWFVKRAQFFELTLLFNEICTSSVHKMRIRPAVSSGNLHDFVSSVVQSWRHGVLCDVNSKSIRVLVLFSLLFCLCIWRAKNTAPTAFYVIYCEYHVSMSKSRCCHLNNYISDRSL